MADVVIYDLADHAIKGLGSGNSHATAFASVDVLTGTPKSAYPDGIYDLGASGQFAARRIFLAPYCEGAPGSQFSVRVYGWRGLAYPEGLPSAMVVVPYLIAEFLCTACNRTGPLADNPVAPSMRLIRETERLCDTISLTQGSIGTTGQIYSTGPGTDLVAFALLEATGARLIQFDFCLADTGNDVGMNLFWAKA